MLQRTPCVFISISEETAGGLRPGIFLCYTHEGGVPEGEGVRPPVRKKRGNEEEYG